MHIDLIRAMDKYSVCYISIITLHDSPQSTASKSTK